MNAQLLIKAAITVALVLLASVLARRPGYVGALVASLPVTSLLVLGWVHADTRDPKQVADMAMGIFWFVLGSLPFFVVLAVALRQGLAAVPAFVLAALAGFGGTVLVQWLLTRNAAGAG
jgi:uncharacterized membrane protein (GlpM family)